MKCYKCSENTEKTYINYISNIGNKNIIIENTPTYTCNNCLERFYEGEVVEKIQNYVEEMENMKFKLITVDYSVL